MNESIMNLHATRSKRWLLQGLSVFAALAAMNATAVTETFDSYANGTDIVTGPPGGVWVPTAGYTVIDGGGVAGSKGLGSAGAIVNWKAQPFMWSTLAAGTKVAISMDFQTAASGNKFDDDRVGWTVNADSATSSANQFALQLDTAGMECYWDANRTVLNALAGIKFSTWYRFRVEFTKLSAASAGIVGTLTELDGSGNPTGTPYVGTIADTSAVPSPAPAARFTNATGQWPSFKNYNAIAGNADNAGFTIISPTLLSENFDSMGSAGTTLPTAWTAGYLGAVGSVNRAAMLPYAGDGQSITAMPVVVNAGELLVSDVGTVLNLGSAGASDRALGNYPRTNPSGDHIMQVAIVNTTGSPLTAVNVSYAGEQWRQYQGTSSSGPEMLRVLASTTSPTTGFTYFPSLDFTAPQQGADGIALDGNLAANRALITGAITFAGALPAGGTFYLRWHDWNDNGTSDHFLGIDDVIVSSTGGSGNLPPTVAITSPANGASVSTGFTIDATAADSDGTIASVAFYDGATLLNTDTIPPYSYPWSGASAGSHVLTAKATDNGGLTSTSSAVNVTVVAPSVPSGTILSQNFSTDPVNYTLPGNSSPFRFDAGTRYWAVSNTPGLTVNAGISGSDGPYLGTQNIDGDTVSFTTAAPAQIDFTLPVSGYSNLKLSIALAGMPAAETENYIRAMTDNDGDGIYETTLFDFKGASNSAYTDSVLGALTAAFKTFSNIVLPTPTAADGKLRLRLESFNDTDSQNEATGIDSIVISAAVPHFTVTADPRSNHTAYNGVLTGIKNTLPTLGTFHVDVGDYDPPANNRAQIDAVFGSSYLWYGPIGNHEAETSTYMEWVRAEYANGNGVRSPLKNSTFQNGPAGSTETMYSVDIGNAHLVFINEYWNGGTAAGSDVARDGDVVAELRAWLDADLKATTKPVKIVFGHEPAYLPAGHNHYGDSLDLYPANRDAFWNILKSNNVIAMMNGHTHDYYKLSVDGVWQIDAGNAGNDNTGDGYTFIDVILGASNVQFDIWRDTAKNGTWLKSAESFAAPVPSSEKDITSFTFPGLGSATITGTAISMFVPNGTNVKALAPTYTLSSEVATCVPVSNPTNPPGLDFTGAVHYIVTAGDHSTKDYTVTVTVLPPYPVTINMAYNNSMDGTASWEQRGTASSVAPMTYTGTTWNNGGNGSAAVSNLKKSNGDTSGISVSKALRNVGSYAPGSFGSMGGNKLASAAIGFGAWAAGDTAIMGQFQNILTFSGFEVSHSYDIAFVLPGNGGRTAIYKYSLQTANAPCTDLPDWVLAQNYALLSACIPNDSGEITIQMICNGIDWSALCGWQILDNGVRTTPNPEALIYSFNSLPGAGPVTMAGTGISMVMPIGSSVSALIPTFVMSGGASCTLATVGGTPIVSGTSPVNFTGPVRFIVKSEDGTTTTEYTVTVNLIAPSGKIHVNVDGTLRTGLVGPGGGLGETWNQLLGGTASSASALLDSGGVVTGVGYSSSNLGGPDAWGAPVLQLLRAGLRNFDTSAGNSQQLVIHNLTAGRKYDVWLASANLSDQRHNGVWSTPNVTDIPGDHPCGNTAGANGDTWVEANNYVVFSNTVAAVDGTITFNGYSIAVAGFDCRLPLSGFQLADATAVPSGYAAWAGEFAGNGEANEDFNHDGVQNGIAYFMGMNGLTTHPGVIAGKVTWPHVGAVASFEVRVSDNLKDWVAADPGDVDTTSVPGFVIYTFPQVDPKKFCRLSVTP